MNTTKHLSIIIRAFTLIFFCIGIFLSKGVYAASATCTVSFACPAGQSGTLTYRGTFSYPSNVGSASQYCAWNKPTQDRLGGYTLISSTCVSNAPTLVGSRSESQTLTCPATQPSGTLIQTRTYDLYSDGSAKNYSAWYYSTNTCVAIKKSTQTESQTGVCPATQPSGTLIASRTYDLWTDGSAKNYSAWYYSTNTCVAVKQSTQTESQALTCPATTPSGSLIQSRTYDLWSDGSAKNYSGWSITTNTCVAIRQSVQTESQALTCPATQPSGTLTQSRTYEIWSDGTVKNYSGWSITTNTCVAIKQSTQTQNQTLACPAAQPSGTWTQTRNYDLWTDGSTKNFTAWVDVTKTCQAIVSSTGTNQRALNCPSGQTGNITQSRAYQLWTDGRIVYTTNWSVIANTCKVNDIAANDTKRVEACSEGYTGKKTYKWITQYKDVVYNTVDTEGNPITYTLTTPYLVEVLDTNTCTLIPTTQTSVVNDSSQSVSCDSFYNAPSGTYNGTVIIYGKNITTYSSATKTTSTVFTPSSNNDVSGCTASSSSVEYRDGVCDTGQTGTQVEYSYVTTVNGVKNYSKWSVFSSTCKVPEQAVVPDDAKENKKVASVISNMSVTSTALINKNDYNTFLQTIKNSSWAANEEHTLNIVIDDLSKNVYNPTKLTNAVNSFKDAVGATYGKVQITSIPKDLSKYKGYNGLSDTTNKAFKNATIDANNVIVLQYLDLSQKDSNGLPKTQTVNIPIFSSSMGASIKSNEK